MSFPIPNMINKDGVLPKIQLSYSKTIKEYWQHNALHFLVWFSRSQVVCNLFHITIEEYNPI